MRGGDLGRKRSQKGKDKRRLGPGMRRQQRLFRAWGAMCTPCVRVDREMHVQAWELAKRMSAGAFGSLAQLEVSRHVQAEAGRIRSGTLLCSRVVEINQ